MPTIGRGLRKIRIGANYITGRRCPFIDSAGPRDRVQLVLDLYRALAYFEPIEASRRHIGANLGGHSWPVSIVALD
jgi:hypothetical protein